MYPKVSTQPVVKLCSVVTAGRLSLGRFFSSTAFFARFIDGRETFVATVRALAVLLYFLATFFSHRQLFQKPGRFLLPAGQLSLLSRLLHRPVNRLPVTSRIRHCKLAPTTCPVSVSVNLLRYARVSLLLRRVS